MNPAWRNANDHMVPITPTGLLRNYIKAKDENRPHLLSRVFAESAYLEMRVKTQSISFPAVTQGVTTIADVLVRRFNQVYENIYTFYMDKPPVGQKNLPTVFVCDWLVGMSEKASGNVRIGCGRYEWVFQQKEPRRVERLAITIEEMQTLPPDQLPHVLDWLLALDYPWTSAQATCALAPTTDQLAPVLDYLRQGTTKAR